MIDNLLQNPEIIITIFIGVGVLILFYKVVSLILELISGFIKVRKLSDFIIIMVIAVLLGNFIVHVVSTTASAITKSIELTIPEIESSRDLILEYLTGSGVGLNVLVATQEPPETNQDINNLLQPTTVPTLIPTNTGTPLPTVGVTAIFVAPTFTSTPVPTVEPTIDITIWNVLTPVPTRKPNLDYQGFDDGT